MLRRFKYLISVELGVGSASHSTDSLDVHSVGNSQTLRETAIIEALNLKAAVEYDVKNCMYYLSPLKLCAV